MLKVEINNRFSYETMQAEKRKTSSSGSELGKDDFLNILMTQLQNQDPSNPVDDKEFIAQLATFSTLEQITNLNTTVQSFIEEQKPNTLLQLQSLIDQNVTWSSTEENGQTKKEQKGIIKSVYMDDNQMMFETTEGLKGNTADLDKIGVQNADVLGNASNLIGRTIGWQEDGAEKEAAVTAVSLKNGILLFEMENGNTIKQSQITRVLS
ncbi:flagellar hook assembly protein FlgD [Priestia filamentosa]|uniref:flagellar hook capping FlgD N-terminal domain-containing protein n=1 Tax=Priestia filamentosa TaxID=1402861 RepID=UPI001FB2F6D0|nr:flagellar hook capping FlgD N-terminal domain-containing protein [Priestia filamentosa]MED3724996.1 flagellar hook capping FlgD N-terminal domain-containing protein [Priestia filamentosa]UOE61736.1 flagellar hook assembly protein FlgD [Priestia filamentosa]